MRMAPNPVRRLAAATVLRALADAKRGDGEAIAWCESDIAEQLADALGVDPDCWQHWPEAAAGYNTRRGVKRAAMRLGKHEWYLQFGRAKKTELCMSAGNEDAGEGPAIERQEVRQ
jgi:hypothetical protein